MQIIYTEKNNGFGDGANYRNPRYFDGVESGVMGVVLDGEYPAIAKAYEDAGIEVTVISGEAAQSAPDSVEELKVALAAKGITFATNAKKAELLQLWQAASESE